MAEPSLKIPAHVAIIMDGNGRWAEARGLSRFEGHQAGTENLRRVIRDCVYFGIQYLTIYAFSTENWARPKEEVTGLMTLLESVIDNELAELAAEGVQIRHMGHLAALPPGLQDKVKHAIEVTKHNHKLVLNIAWNYGGRDEIVHAIQRIIQHKIAPEALTEDLVSEYLYSCGTPDPDLIIRTSGEMRISNFLIWQSAYSEWYFTSTLWPDFDREELRKAIVAFSQRDRRFGKLSGEAADNPNG
ncbi:MAG: isoprenyl transferase [Anaerolineaceae bacterium]|jgi:undecaprenyl diphosphate synthase